MNYFSIDAIIVYTFLIVTLVIGLWAGRNVKTIKDYAIANRIYGTGVLTITMLATFITGSQALGYIGYVFDDGILPFISIVFCGVIICFFFIARYIAPNIMYFEGCLTMAEVMGKLFGSTVRVCIGILGIFYCMVMVTLQIIWLGYIGNIINISNELGVIIGGIFLIIYSSRGGMRAIAITDIIQFIALSLLVPLAASLLLYKIGGVKNIFTYVPSNNFKFIYHPSLKDYLVYCLWGLFPAFLVSFPFMQRMLMAKNKRQIVHSQYIGIGYLTIFYILLTLIGLAAISLKVMGDANMPQQGSQVFVYLVENYFPVGLKGIIGIGLLGAVMSTADSFLHSAGILLIYDVVQPLLKKKQGNTNSLRLVQYTTLILGLISLFIALTYKVLPRIQYGGVDLGKGINIGIDFVAIIFTTPLIAGIMGLKTDTKSFYISFIITFISFFVGRFLIPNLLFIPFNIFINAISFFGSHYLQNKEFKFIHRRYNIMEINTCWNPSLKSLSKSLMSISSRYLKYCIQNTVAAKPNYTLFAVFACLNFMIPFLFHNYNNHNIYVWSLGIRIIGLCLCMGLLLKPYWPYWMNKYLANYWYITIFYCLPFTTIFTFLLNGCTMLTIMHIGLSTMMLMFLVNWANFFILNTISIALAYILYKNIFPQAHFIIDLNAKYLLLYELAFLVIIGKFFLQKQESSNNYVGAIPRHFVGTFLNEQLEAIMTGTQRLTSHLDKYIDNTERAWHDSSDGFETLYVSKGMQTIDDPDLLLLLLETLPSLKAMRDETKAAAWMLHESIKTRFTTENLNVQSIKGYIVDALFELNIKLTSYSCTIYKINYNGQLPNTLHVITFTPTNNQLIIKDYSQALSKEETKPLLDFFAATKGKYHDISNSKVYLEDISKRIESIKDGYKTYTLDFPNMELVA